MYMTSCMFLQSKETLLVNGMNASMEIDNEHPLYVLQCESTEKVKTNTHTHAMKNIYLIIKNSGR